MTANAAIIVIDKCLRRSYRKPLRCQEKNNAVYLQKLYGNWAVGEIRDYINNHRDWDPLMAVEEFRYAMDTLATSSKKSKNHFMFSVAYDVASHILDELITEGV